MSSSFAGGAAGQGGPSALFAGSSWILMPSKASFFMVRNVCPVRLASDRITGLSHLSETKNPGPSSVGFRKKALVTLSPVKNFASTGAERCSGWKRCLRGALWTFTRKISCPHFGTDQESFFPVVFGWRYFSSNQGPCRGISSSPVPPDFFWAFSASVSQVGTSAKCRCMGLVFVDPFHLPLLTHTTASAVEPFVLEQQPQESAQQQQRHIPAAVAAPAASAWTSLGPWLRV